VYSIAFRAWDSLKSCTRCKSLVLIYQ
jgi:hypothetical protein